MSLVAALRECPATRYAALLRAAIDDPDNTDARRALADAMRADGVDWAALIDLQIEWNKLPQHQRDRQRANLARQAEILRRYPKLHRAVAGEVGTRGRLSMGRGLVEHATIDATTLLAHADELRALAPLMSLELFPMTEAEAVTLARLPQLKSVRQLRLASPTIGDAGVVALAGSPHLAKLKDLELYDAGIGDATVQHIASAAAFDALRRLMIANTRLSHPAIDALANGPRLASLRELALEGRSIDEHAVRTLARSAQLRLELLSLVTTAAGAALGELATSPVVEELRTLTLTHASDDAEATIRLIASLAHLEALHLEGCVVGDEIVAKLARGVRELALCGAGITAEGARVLARASNELWRLNLGRNAVGDGGAEALAEAAFAGSLTRLNLEDNGMGPHAVAGLARHMHSLVVLNLSRNPIGDEGARLLAESPALTNVELLVLQSCGITSDGARRLLDSPTLARARRIVLTREVGSAIQQELRARRADLEPLLAGDLS